MPRPWTTSLVGVAACAALWTLGCERGAPSSSAADAGPGRAAALPEQPAFDLESEVARLASGAAITFEPSDDSAYARLQRGASDAQWRQLLRHSSPAVRVSAFHALAERHVESSLFSELSPLLRDGATVVSGEGCYGGGEQTVADLVLSEVEGRLSDAERAAILRDWLAQGTRLEVTSRAKRTWSFGEELHETFRELVRRGDPDALLGLARYRDRDDVPAIAAALGTEQEEAALQAIALFPDARFVAPLRQLQQRLFAERFAPIASFPSRLGSEQLDLVQPSRQRSLCRFYATALQFPPALTRAWFAAPVQAATRVADPVAHAKCLGWALSPERIAAYADAGFGLWSRARTISLEQARELWEADPQRAARVVVDVAPHLGEYLPGTAIWMLQQLKRHPDRGRVLAGLRAALRHADIVILNHLGEVIRHLELRELIPDLLARLQQTQPLADPSLETFRAHVARPLVYTLARLELSEAEKQQLVRWVIDGRAARERATHDPDGQRILEDLLADMLRRQGLLGG